MNKLCRFLKTLVVDVWENVGAPILIVVCVAVLLFVLGTAVGHIVNYFHPINIADFIKVGASFPPPLTIFGTIVLVFASLAATVVVGLWRIGVWVVVGWRDF